jgi:two-component system, LytTR family, response regulator
MIDIIIVEDELLAFELLSSIISEYVADVTIRGCASDIEAGKELISATHPDLIFVDVQLGDKLVFELLEQIDYRRYNIVFTTAYESYAFKAFKFEAVDYLLKPYSPKEVIKVIENVRQKVNSSPDLDWSKVSKALSNRKEKISLHTFEGITLCNQEDILYCEADGAYSKVFTKDQGRLMVSRSVGDLESQLNADQFVRVHTSHLVNIDHVRKFIKEDGGFIQMSDGCLLPVSRRKKQDFLNRIQI